MHCLRLNMKQVMLFLKLKRCDMKYEKKQKKKQMKKEQKNTEH